MPDRRVLAIALLLLCGCGVGDSTSTSQAEPAVDGIAPLKSLHHPLSEQELRQFLFVVKNLPGQQVPQFAPADIRGAEPALPGTVLVELARDRFHLLGDPLRQGKLWQRDRVIADATRQAGLRTADFAILISRLSYAILKAELEERYEFDQLMSHYRRQAAELMQRIDEFDRSPVATQTAEATERRARDAHRLEELVMFMEVARSIRDVPAESVALVRRHHQVLAPLVPKLGDPFASDLAAHSEGASRQAIQPAVYRR